MVALLELKLQELLQLLTTPSTKPHIGRNELYNLVVKLQSMHLTVSGAVSHLYHIQNSLSQGWGGRAWIPPDFHQCIEDWRALVIQTAYCTTRLVNIVRQ